MGDTLASNTVSGLRALRQMAATPPCGTSLHSISAMPPHLRFNKFVLSGYRPFPMTAIGCVRSMFQLHNETGNIYSHLVPLVVALGACADPWSTDSWVYHTQMALICGVLSCSVVYHTFMPARSEFTYSVLLMIDYCGIFLLLTVIPLIVVIPWGLEQCDESTMLIAYIMYGCTSMVSLSILLYPALRWGTLGTATHRLGALALQFVARTCIYTARASLDCGRKDALRYYWVMELLSVFGGIVNSSRCPERWLRGQLDLGPNSHQIMHLSAAVAIATMYVATQADFVQHVQRVHV